MGISEIVGHCVVKADFYIYISKVLHHLVDTKSHK